MGACWPYPHPHPAEVCPGKVNYPTAVDLGWAAFQGPERSKCGGGLVTQKAVFHGWEWSQREGMWHRMKQCQWQPPSWEWRPPDRAPLSPLVKLCDSTSSTPFLAWTVTSSFSSSVWVAAIFILPFTFNLHVLLQSLNNRGSLFSLC